ncbi:hypothetical protein QHF83_41380, partial [Polyangium sp. 15x6]|nr:hypothetical protein [Polyangium sp. 15x6]
MKHSFFGLAGALALLPCMLGTASCGTGGDATAYSSQIPPDPSGSGGAGGSGGAAGSGGTGGTGGTG